MLRYGFITLPRDIGGALLIGLVLAGLLGALVPASFFADTLGRGIMPMLLMIVIGIPLYICATASVPVAAALIAAGISPGAALVFLVAGPATNAATITTIWKFLGKVPTLIYLGVVAIGGVLSGLLLDLIYVQASIPVVSHDHEIMPTWLSWGSAIALLIIIAWSYLSGFIAKQQARGSASQAEAAQPGVQAPATEQLVLAIDGMTCHNCSSSVQRQLARQPNISSVDVDLESGTATISGTGLDGGKLAEVVSLLGYSADVRKLSG
jgi:copper chaperone CopZ